MYRYIHQKQFILISLWLQTLWHRNIVSWSSCFMWVIENKILLAKQNQLVTEESWICYLHCLTFLLLNSRLNPVIEDPPRIRGQQFAQHYLFWPKNYSVDAKQCYHVQGRHIPTEWFKSCPFCALRFILLKYTNKY